MLADAPGNDKQRSATPAGFMTQAEYGRHRRYTNRSTVSRLVSRGILVMHGKLVDVAASYAVLDGNPVDGEEDDEDHEDPLRLP